MNRIDEIVESLEKVVEHVGEQIDVEPVTGAECQSFLWTCLRDLARYVRGTPQDFEGEENTIDLIIQRALGSHSLGQAQLDAMRRLAKEILFLRATCRSAGLNMEEIERGVNEMLSASEMAERAGH